MSSSDVLGDDEKYSLRVHTYHPKVKEFERREDGSRMIGSLSGPARIEARQQDARDRVVAGAELKVLQERLRWCYHKEGVNHYENCKQIADLYVSKLRVHDSWLLKVRLFFSPFNLCYAMHARLRLLLSPFHTLTPLLPSAGYRTAWFRTIVRDNGVRMYLFSSPKNLFFF